MAETIDVTKFEIGKTYKSTSHGRVIYKGLDHYKGQTTFHFESIDYPDSCCYWLPEALHHVFKDVTQKGRDNMAKAMNMPENREKLYRHILWMLRNMPNKEDNPRKWNRWLGFLQGVCFNEGHLSIKELEFLNKRGLNVALESLRNVFKHEACAVLNCDTFGLINQPKRWEDISDDDSG